MVFFGMFAPGFVVMIVFYMALTAFRDFRDNFAPELWTAFGYGTPPTIFAVSELIVGVIVLIPIALFMLIKSQIATLVAYHVLIIGGMVVTGFCAFLYKIGSLSGLYLMVISGIALFCAYVPFGCVIFDLLIATFHVKATSGFLIYVSDSLGYLSSVAILLVKNFAVPDWSWDQCFVYMSFGMAGLGIVCMTVSLIYFTRKYAAYDWVKIAPTLLTPSNSAVAQRLGDQ
jgi:hypothetical protein